MKISRKCVHQVLACLPALFVQFLSGIGWGWTAPTLLKLQDVDSDFLITTGQASWLVSVGEIGRMTFTLLSSLLLDNLGRKKTLLLGSVLYSLVWTTVVYTRNVYVLLGTRMLFGIAEGFSDVASTIYIAETCSPNLRGVLLGAGVLSLLAGITIEFTVSAYSSYTSTAIVNSTLAIGTICSQYLALESTYFLTMKGKHEEAKKNFTRLHSDYPDIDGELRKIRDNAEEEVRKRKSLSLLFVSPTNLKALLATTGFGFLLATVGFHSVLPYLSMILVSSEQFTANEYSIMYGAAKFMGTAISLFVVERINRRPLILTSFAIITCCNACIAILLYLHGKEYDVLLYPWLLFSCLALEGFFACLMITAACSIMSEILPLSVRAIGGSMSMSAGAGGSFVTTILFWPIAERFGMQTNFLIYVITSLLTLLFVYIVIPETRGKALHEMYEKSDKTDGQA